MSTYIVFIRRKNSQVERVEVDAYSPHDAKRIVRKKLRKETFKFIKVIEK